MLTDVNGIMCAALTERQPKSSQIVRTHWGQAGLTLRALNIFTPTQSLHLCCNLDMTLQAGNSLLIVGPSGCGKSSMLRAIAGWPFGSFGQPHQYSRHPCIPWFSNERHRALLNHGFGTSGTHACWASIHIRHCCMVWHDARSPQAMSECMELS